MQRSPLWEEIRAEGREEGREEALRETILQLSRKRFGRAATARQRAQLAAITDLARLERIRDRLLEAPTWANLLATL
jgi:hypothetical protein